MKIVLLLLLCTYAYSTCRDLEDLVQDFVLETKKIEIPDYPDAFNPSIIRWRDRLLMAFRTRDPKTGHANPIGLVFLDDDYCPISTPQLMNLRFKNPFLPSWQQDPRLITVDERLYMVYSNSKEDLFHMPISRVFVTELHFDGEQFYAEEPECLLRFEGEIETRKEKNWVPFDYMGHLLLAYSLKPHRILHPLLGVNTCQTIASTQGSIKWLWGEMRGGTPALKYGDEYLAFFHCCKSMKTCHSDEQDVPHYFMGAYTFSGSPPFALTRISPKPIIGKNFYHGARYHTWKPLHVVFPSGFVFDDRYIWISYGRQDHEAWVVKLDAEGLIKSLIPVLTTE